MRYLAKTFKGLESVLAQELMNLGASNVREAKRAVTFEGDKALLYRANLCLRTASRILMPILTFKAKDTDSLYEQLKALDWSAYMTAKTTFAVDATVYSDFFRHSEFLRYRVKDAIVDYWRDKTGERPSVKIDNPDLLFNIHASQDMLTLSIDSSGESLHKRGYRVTATEAPINEALAAGMLFLAGWNGQTDFYDPMCGSGTLLIEAALMALNIPPGIFRKSFAFEKWNDFDADLWQDIYNDDSMERPFHHHIYGSDAGYYAVQAALKNIHSAQLDKYISVRQVRIQELHDIIDNHSSSNHGPLVMMNPPYGERLSHDKDVLRLYQDIGTALKHHFTGADAWIISSNEEALKCVGLKPSERIHLLNGELDCLFNHYKLFTGTHKDFKKNTTR